MAQKPFILTVFLVCYLLILARKVNPVWICFSGALTLLFSNSITLGQALASINYNVLGVFVGTMVLSNLFAYSGVPAYLAAKLVNKSQQVSVAFLLVCGLSSFISSFTENIATVLIIAPLALEIAVALQINPVPLLIGVAITSNLQGCATMIGDPPSIILAMESGMNFNDFFWMPAVKTGGALGKPGVFFAVELGALTSLLVIWYIFKRYKSRPKEITPVRPKTFVPAWLLVFMVISLAVSSLLPQKSQYLLAGICLFWGVVGLIWHGLRHRESLSALRDLDWQSFFFLAGIFILVGSLSYSGIIKDIARYISLLSGQSALSAYILIIVISVLVSAFVDNIPYTMAMIPVAKMVAADLGVSMYPFLFGLLLGTCLGGNITPIGSVTNIVAVGLLRKKGYQVKFRQFLAIGFPFTVAAVLVSSLFVWTVWM